MSEEIIDLAEALDEAGQPYYADLARELPLPPVDAIALLAHVWRNSQKELAAFRLLGIGIPERERAEDLSRNAYNQALREVYDGGE